MTGDRNALFELRWYKVELGQKYDPFELSIEHIHWTVDSGRSGNGWMRSLQTMARTCRFSEESSKTLKYK